jgi:hypothetical protein
MRRAGAAYSSLSQAQAGRAQFAVIIRRIFGYFPGYPG